MTTDDLRNLQLRLTRMGDTDAAYQVGVLLAAFEDACEKVCGVGDVASVFLRLAEDALREEKCPP